MAQATSGGGEQTSGPEYAERLRRLEGARWKQLCNVQAPYRRHIRSLHLGRSLDVGCGIGRNLEALDAGSVGVDHNADAVAIAGARGLIALTPADFYASEYARPGSFDSMLVAHVLEHVDASTADDLLHEYLAFVRPGGTVVLITPQEAGFKTDHTHVRFVEFDTLSAHARQVGLHVRRTYSFPLWRQVGRVFPYNEFVLVATRA